MFKQDVDVYSAMEAGHPFGDSYSMDEAMSDKIVRQGFVRKVFGVSRSLSYNRTMLHVVCGMVLMRWRHFEHRPE